MVIVGNVMITELVRTPLEKKDQIKGPVWQSLNKENSLIYSQNQFEISTSEAMRT